MNSASKKRRVILFDMDGTLIDSRNTIAHHFIRAMNETGIQHDVSMNALAEQLETPFEELMIQFGIQLESGQFETFITTYRHNYHQDPLNGTTIFNGVTDTLSRL